MTIIRCIEADARPPVIELDLGESPGFSIFAMSDAMEGERWLRTTVLRRTDEAPPPDSVLIVEVSLGGVNHEGNPTLMVREQGRFVSVELRKEKSRARMAAGVELPNRCTFEVTLPNQRKMSFDMEVVHGREQRRGGALTRSPVIGPDQASKWNSPTIASLLAKARDYVRTQALALARKLGLNMGTLALLATFGTTAAGAGYAAYKNYKAAQEAQEKAAALEGELALLGAGRDAAAASERSCLVERKKLAMKLGDLAAERKARADSVLAVSLAQNVALELGGRRMGSKEVLALDKEQLDDLRKYLVEQMASAEGSPSEAQICIEQAPLLGSDLPRYLLLWHQDPEVVCPPDYDNVLGNTDVAGRWGLSTRTAAQYGTDDRGQAVDRAVFESAEDPRQDPRWSGRALVTSMRVVQKALLAHPAGGRPPTFPSQAQLWSLALLTAANQLPSPVGGAQDRPAEECVKGLLDDLSAQQRADPAGVPLLPDLVDVAREDAVVVAQPRPGCPWQQDAIRDAARAALRAATWLAVVEEPAE